MPFIRFCVAAWAHWEARFGTTFAVMLAVAQYMYLEFADPKKIPAWVRDFPPSLWLAVGILLLFWSCYGAWYSEYQARNAAEKRVDALKPKLGFSADSQGFYLTHLGGEAARYIEIDPMTNEAGSSVSFDPIDFLEIGNNRRPLLFRLAVFSPARTPLFLPAKMDKVIFVMCRRWGNTGDKEYPIRIKFNWNDYQLEEKVVLKWVANEGRFETRPQ
jgi:hypothetical protein